MTPEQIDELVSTGEFPENTQRPDLIETHISWVLMCRHFVYKIKKPVKYSFVDFSTVEKRLFYCERELMLNRRLTEDMYLDVLPVRSWQGSYVVGGRNGNIVEYALRMKRQDPETQMDTMLLRNEVTFSDILQLAQKIASFHKQAKVLRNRSFINFPAVFGDLESEKSYLEEHLAEGVFAIIDQAISISDIFNEEYHDFQLLRIIQGFFRDVHGDLHSGNIFLLPDHPQVFDCVEFNDKYRQIDVLNDIAFLCMDLDGYGREDLSDLLFSQYNRLFPCVNSDADYLLFIYYKSYCANIRLKVNSLRAREISDEGQRKKALNQANKYLLLMNEYIHRLGDRLSVSASR